MPSPRTESWFGHRVRLRPLSVVPREVPAYCDFVSYAAPREAIDHEGYADAVLARARRARPGFRLDSAQRRHAPPRRNERLLRRRDAEPVGPAGARPCARRPDPVEVFAVRRGLGGHRRVQPRRPPPRPAPAPKRSAMSRGVNRLLDRHAIALRRDQLTLPRPPPTIPKDGALSRAIRGGAKAASGIPRISDRPHLRPPRPGRPRTPERDQADTLADLEGLAHLSCYQLTIEPGDAVRRAREAEGVLPRADDGLVAEEAFLAIDEALAARGLAHYEVSNYAAPGEEARHNLGYWRGEECTSGLGCGSGRLPADATRRRRRAPRGVRYRNDVEPGEVRRVDPRGSVIAPRSAKNARTAGRGDAAARAHHARLATRGRLRPRRTRATSSGVVGWTDRSAHP